MSTNTDQIEANAAVLEVLLPRLQERREAIQKEVLKYGEAPAGIKEVFELCRGFERAYVSFVNESPVAGKIKEAFMAEKGLAGMIRKQPLEKVYELQNVKQVARQADGYQPHLVSPENGLRLLASEALDFVAGPVSTCVQTVHTLLLNAAREAAEKAGQFTEAALMGALPMNVPDFKNVVMPAIVTALDEWKREAEKMAAMLVDMERTYMTAGFFRHTMYHRANKIKQQQMLARAAEAKADSGIKGVFGGKSFFPAFGASSQQPGAGGGAPPPGPPPAPSGAGAAASPPQSAKAQDAASDGSGEDADGKAAAAAEPAPAPAGGGAFNAAEMTDPNSFLAGMFEKYNGTDSSFTSMAAGLRWQRRFFIFSEAQRMLYYFKTAEDVAKGGQPRGMVNVAECLIEDLDAAGNPRPPNAPLDKAALIIRVRSKDPRVNAVKDHASLVLRAESAEQKAQWLGRMRRTAEARRPASKQGEQGADGKPFSSFGGSLTNMMDDGGWQDAEPIIDTHLGEGSAVFRADNVRDSDGRLLPAPQTLINPMRIAVNERSKKGAAVNATAEARHDVIMEQLGGDMCIYTRMISDTVITTVPKAIVHSMIRKSEKNLLERLFTVIHHLTPVQLETLLKEDDSVVKSRREARAALEDCKQAIFVVQQMMERRNMANAADRPPTVLLPANCFAYSGMVEHLSKEQRDYFDKLFSSEFAPEAMKSWTVPPQVRALPAAIAAAAARAAGLAPAPSGGRAPPQPPGRPGGRPSPSGQGAAPPPVPQRPGQPGAAPPVPARRAPPPPPGTR